MESENMTVETPQCPAEDAFTRAEIVRAFVRPYKVIEYVLGGFERLARNIEEGRDLVLLTALLVAASILFAVPYGAVPPARAPWKIVVLYLGSLLICLPSLHVFSQYLGFRLSVLQNTALSLVIPTVAAFFSFGFFPIIWFIHATTPRVEDAVVTSV